MGIDRRVGRGFLARTIENRADEIPNESGLLVKVNLVRDLRGIRGIGPRLYPGISHGLNVFKGTPISAGAGSEAWRRLQGEEKTSVLSGREGAGVIKVC